MASETLLDPPQAAAILGVRVETLNTWRCTKRYPLAYIRVGRRIRYRYEDLMAFLDARRVEVREA